MIFKIKTVFGFCIIFLILHKINGYSNNFSNITSYLNYQKENASLTTSKHWLNIHKSYLSTMKIYNDISTHSKSYDYNSTMCFENSRNIVTKSFISAMHNISQCLRNQTQEFTKNLDSKLWSKETKSIFSNCFQLLFSYYKTLDCIDSQMPNKNLKIAQEYESIMSLIKINNNNFVSSINECIKNIEASTNETVAREIIKAKICLKNETAKNNIITSTNLNKYDILNAKDFTSLYNAWNIILKSLETKQADIIKIIMSKAISSYNNVVNDMKINGKNYNCCLNTSINYIDKLKNKSLHAISGCFKNESLNFEKFYSSAILAKNITSFKNCLNNNDNIKTRLNCLDNHKPEKNIFTDIKNTIEKKINNFDISINGCIEKTMKIHREFIIIGFMMFDKCIDNQKSDKCVELNINLTEKKIELENILDDESYMYNWEYYKSYVMIKFNN